MSQSLLSLVLFTLVATITPGGATTLATASGVRFGFRRSLPLLAGIAAGLATLAAVSGAGLGAVLQDSPFLQAAMKLAGSAYLLWLAWQIGKSGPPATGDHGETGGGADRQPSGFWTGVLLLWLNPKGWAMTLGAAASFAILSADPIRLSLILAAAFGLCAAFSLTLWCIGGMLLSRTLKSDGQWRFVNAVLGLLLATSILPVWLG